MLKFITPILLTFMIVYSFWQELKDNYEGYPGSGLLVIGAGAVVLTLLLAFALSLNSRDPHNDLTHSIKE